MRGGVEVGGELPSRGRRSVARRRVAVRIITLAPWHDPPRACVFGWTRARVSSHPPCLEFLTMSRPALSACIVFATNVLRNISGMQRRCQPRNVGRVYSAGRRNVLDVPFGMNVTLFPRPTVQLAACFLL